MTEPRLGRADIAPAVETALERVGLAGAAGRRFRGYSLGMKQRLGLASALLVPRRLVVLDEPTNGLDPAGTREVRRIVGELQAGGATVLLSSHLLAEVEAICTHVAVLQAGSLVVTGELSTLLDAGAGGLEITVTDTGAAVEALRAAGATAFTESPGTVVADGGPPAPRLLAALVHAGVDVFEVHRRRPHLEELFTGSPRISTTGTGSPHDRRDAVHHDRGPPSRPDAAPVRRGAALGPAPPAHPHHVRPVRARPDPDRDRRGRRRRRRGRQRRARPDRVHRRQRAGAADRRDDRLAGPAAAPGRRRGLRRRDRRGGLARHPARAVAVSGGPPAAGRDEGVRGARGRRRRDAGDRRGRCAGRARRGRGRGRAARHALRDDGRVRRGTGTRRAGRAVDDRAARRGGCGRAGRVVVHRAPAGRAGLGARRSDHVRRAERDPGPGLAAALPADHRLVVGRGRAARPAAPRRAGLQLAGRPRLPAGGRRGADHPDVAPRRLSPVSPAPRPPGMIGAAAVTGDEEDACVRCR
ncbi:hypothetical protein L7F22_045084 [Adiantum nelumboides]|nr:hypothetical protein [Adiantum nelumboides]